MIYYRKGKSPKLSFIDKLMGYEWNWLGSNIGWRKDKMI